MGHVLHGHDVKGTDGGAVRKAELHAEALGVVHRHALVLVQLEHDLGEVVLLQRGRQHVLALLPDDGVLLRAAQVAEAQHVDERVDVRLGREVDARAHVSQGRVDVARVGGAQAVEGVLLAVGLAVATDALPLRKVPLLHVPRARHALQGALKVRVAVHDVGVDPRAGAVLKVARVVPIPRLGGGSRQTLRLHVVHVEKDLAQQGAADLGPDLDLVLAGDAVLGGDDDLRQLVRHLKHPLVLQVQLPVVDRVVLDRVVDVGDLADVVLVGLGVVEALEQLAPAVEHQQHALPVARVPLLEGPLGGVLRERAVRRGLVLLAVADAAVAQLVHQRRHQRHQPAKEPRRALRHALDRGVQVLKAQVAVAAVLLGRSGGRAAIVQKVHNLDGLGAHGAGDIHLALRHLHILRRQRRPVAALHAGVVGDLVVQDRLGAADVRAGALAKRLEHGGVLLDQAHQDRRQAAALQVQQPLGEGSGGGLHAALVGGVDLEVMAVRGVQSQQPVLQASLVGVHNHAVVEAQLLRLIPARVRQHAAMLQDKHRLHAAPGLAVGAVRPARRLQLRLAVDAAEVPALLKHRPHDPQLLPDLLATVWRFAADGGDVVRLPRRLLRHARLHLGQLRRGHLQQLLQLVGALQLGLLALGVDVPHEQVEERRRGDLHLELLLGGAVAVADDGQHAAQLVVHTLARVEVLAVHRHQLHLARGAAQVDAGLLLLLGRQRHERLRGQDAEAVRRERGEHDGAQQAGGVVVVLAAVLHEAPAVDVAHVALALLAAQQVEAAHLLSKGTAHEARDLLLVRAQQHREADLLAVRAALHAAVHHRRLPRLCMGIAWPNGVHLDVSAAGGQEVLVDVGAVAADVAGVRRVVVRALVVHLAEQLLHAAAHGVRVVDVDVVVVAVDGLLHKGLLDLGAVEHHVVLRLREALGIRRRLDLLLRAADHHVLRHAHAVVVERLVHRAAVLQEVLLAEVVDEVRPPQAHVVLCLLQREAVGEPGHQALHHRPLLHRLVQDGLIAKVDDLKLAGAPQPVQDLPHRLGLRLLVHGAHTHDNVGQLVGRGAVRALEGAAAAGGAAHGGAAQVRRHRPRVVRREGRHILVRHGSGRSLLFSRCGRLRSR
mmetsp:Transcript_15879/g.39692  ORF Transcript_15879/g.39692 Transcript_15879/m.39692 type:complete len:1113 (+) Transcript_15879:556-3894(+)